MFEESSIDHGPFIVGNRYIRPVIKIENVGHFAYIHGHDGDIADSPFHYHLDARFISDLEYRKILGTTPDLIIGVRSKETKIMSVTCYRKFIPPLQTIFDEKQHEAYQKLENLCKNRICQGDFCPHQGTDLTSVEPIEVDGKIIRVCPSHGLQWEKTGSMLPRKNPLNLISIKIKMT